MCSMARILFDRIIRSLSAALPKHKYIRKVELILKVMGEGRQRQRVTTNNGPIIACKCFQWTNDRMIKGTRQLLSVEMWGSITCNFHLIRLLTNFTLLAEICYKREYNYRANFIHLPHFQQFYGCEGIKIDTLQTLRHTLKSASLFSVTISYAQHTGNRRWVGE